MFKRGLWVAVAVIAIVAGSLVTADDALGSGDDIAAMEQFLSITGRYLEISDQFVEMLSSRERAVFLAVEGITEIYEDRGEKAAAIQHLEGLLEKYGDKQTVRNSIRFKLRDLYRETGQAQKALDELDQIIKENAD